MDLKKPIVSKDGETKVAYVDPESLSAEDKKLIDEVNKGHIAEAALVEKLHKVVDESEFDSGEIFIDNDKGSYLRLASVEGIETQDGVMTGQAITTELVNGHMTEVMTRINEALTKSAEETNADETIESA